MHCAAVGCVSNFRHDIVAVGQDSGGKAGFISLKCRRSRRRFARSDRVDPDGHGGIHVVLAVLHDPVAGVGPHVDLRLRM